MTPEIEQELERIAQAVSDGTRVDWDREKVSQPLLKEALAGLGMIERVRDVHGGPADTGMGTKTTDERTEAMTRSAGPTHTPAAHRETPFEWGSLEVLEQVGEGSGGFVYRAFDPKLQTDVALKLRKPGAGWSDTDPGRFLSEARHLAKVHHPNVLAVHGADEHDGLLGIWTDYVTGRSLQAQVCEQGYLSAREAALIGLDLCRAVAAVHGKGLLHRDIKASNVMREQGGRILLMDFGSMVEQRPPGAAPEGTDTLEGTPLYMAPEQLRDGTTGIASDIYALGVLLYYLVSGRHPVEAANMFELRRRHEEGDSLPLRDLRPDLPLDFVQVVEKAMASDPRDRYRSAGALERALAGTIGVTVPPPPVPVWLRAAAGVAVAAVAILIFGLRMHPQPPPVDNAGKSVTQGGSQTVPVPATPGPQAEAPSPAAPLEAQATLVRWTEEGDRPVRDGERVSPGEDLAMSFESQAPVNLYVLNQDSQGEVWLLFPVPGLQPGNPLAATVAHRLPGQGGDSTTYWTVTSVGQRESIIAVGSREPLKELEDLVASIPPVASGRTVQRYPQVPPSVLERLRGIGGMEKKPTVSGKTRMKLDDAFRSLEERRKEKGDVWISRWTLRNPS